MAGPPEIRNVIARLPEHARLAVGTITRAAFTTGLNRILLGAAVIALVSGVVSLAAIRGRLAGLTTKDQKSGAERA